VPTEKAIHSFSIIESQENVAFLSFVGIKTPGLTCANELGCYAADRMASMLGAEANTEFRPKETAPLRLHDLPFRELANLIKDNSAYGKIVCRCRNISAGEIIDSMQRNPGAVTVDGVKRRTGASSGRCQGSFCTQRIMELLAREQDVPIDSVNKDGPGSDIIKNEKD
jgi:glycerol-3-phosphate dehydrogenase